MKPKSYVLVGAAGLEPASLAAEDFKSPAFASFATPPHGTDGAGGGIRTPDLRFRRPLLYPAALRRRIPFWWVRRDSNPHAFRRLVLSQLRLPFRHEPILWRTDWDSNPGDALAPGGFQDRCLQPLGHLSVPVHPITTHRPLQRGFDGAARGIRTPDTRIRSPVLYPLSYGGIALYLQTLWRKSLGKAIVSQMCGIIHRFYIYGGIPEQQTHAVDEWGLVPLAENKPPWRSCRTRRDDARIPAILACLGVQNESAHLG